MAHPAMRQMLERGTTVVAPGVHDAITARLMRHLGFPALYVSGAWTAAALGRQEALRRARAAVELGVDGIMVSRVPDRAHFEWFRAELPNIPLLALIGPGYPDLPEYEALGYRIVIYPNITMLSALRALHGVYSH